MSSKIVKHIPKHTVYVEPFAGGLSILFKKPYPNVTDSDHYREVINDLDGRLINMYRVFQTRWDEINHLIQNTLYSRSEHSKAISILKGDLEADDLWKAWAYYVSIQMSFSNQLNCGFRTGVYGRNLQKTWSNKSLKIGDFKDRLKDVCIENESALDVIKRWDSPQSFFYCDPPYPGSNQGHYGGYTQKDFQDLIETLKCIDGSAMVSSYESDEDCPDGWLIESFESHCTSSGEGKVGEGRNKSVQGGDLGDRKRVEKLWIKPRTSDLRPDLQKLMYETDKFDCFRDSIAPE